MSRYVAQEIPANSMLPRAVNIYLREEVMGTYAASDDPLHEVIDTETITKKRVAFARRAEAEKIAELLNKGLLF